jgi:hypothetical protein
MSTYTISHSEGSAFPCRVDKRSVSTEWGYGNSNGNFIP